MMPSRMFAKDMNNNIALLSHYCILIIYTPCSVILHLLLHVTIYRQSKKYLKQKNSQVLQRWNVQVPNSDSCLTRSYQRY